MSTDSVPHAASGALAELLEVSPQVDAAVILERDGGRLLASAPATADRMAEQLGTTCTRILDAAEQARTELGREPVSQVEVATPDGHVFVVADATWVVAAVTDADPTVGLVFYDLKTALRTVREARSTSSNGHDAAASGTPLVTATEDAPGGDGGTSEGDDAGSSEGSEAGSGRWRRKKP